MSGKQKEAAIELAKFLMSKDTQQILVAKNGWYRPNVAYWGDASDAMNAAIQRIMVKGEPVHSTLDSLHETIAAAVKKKGAQYPPSG